MKNAVIPGRAADPFPTATGCDAAEETIVISIRYNRLCDPSSRRHEIAAGERRMRDMAQDPAPAEARDAAYLEVEEVLKRAREAVARSREILESSRRAVDAAPGPSPPPADPKADAA
jgi:hypothetical protein